MKKPLHTGKVLQHLELLTRFRDASLLKISLMNTLLTLTQISEVRLYDVLESDGEYLLTLSAWSERGVVSGNDVYADDQVTEIVAGSPIAQALSSLAPVTQPFGDGFRTCVPNMVNDKPIAIFEFESQQPLTEYEQEVMNGIIGVFRNYMTLLRDSQHDTLTGLLNRKTFDHGFAGLLASYNVATAKQFSEQRHVVNSHWVAVMDIDHFKRINDKFGHLYGDEVLILLANLMRRSFRRHDRLYRFGGEEFLVLMRNVDVVGVRSKLDSFRRTIERHEFPQVGRVTVSIGFTAITATDAPSAVIGKADEALYFAKEHGRDQVCGYEDLVARGDLAPSQLSNQDVEFF